MTILYVSCPLNKLSVIGVDNESGNLLQTLQTIYPIVDPLPEGLLVDNGMTEWMDTTPGGDMLYALTSFWNKAHAMLTAFSIGADGRLIKLGGASVSTEGYQAASGSFSADGSTYVVGHHNCGTITVFSVLEDGPPIVLSTVKPPELTGMMHHPSFQRGNHDTPPTIAPPRAVHHVQYARMVDGTQDADVLLVADCAQDAAIIYSVDDMGHFDDRPLAHVRCQPHASSTTARISSGWMQALFRYSMRYLFKVSPHGFRLRRVALGRTAFPSDATTSNESILYCIGELTNTIQVYKVQQQSSNSRDICIAPEPIQELVVAGHSLAGAKYIGLGVTVISEMQLYEEDRTILVGVRGLAKGWNSKAEMGVRVLKQLIDGRLELGQFIQTPGAVRHFSRRGSELFVGMNAEEYPFVQKYVLEENGLWKFVGQAKVDMDVLCVVPLR
ncbi:hypothetical protein MPSEU_000041700 [Mayamaea pseudoterrestris]|nr:hypothetical protein MPSEU_000041700 [Mayamaea pseudoterrestris]